MLPENYWIRRTKRLTQALIISGTLNIGLVATFAYFVLKEKQQTLAMELKPSTKESQEPLVTNAELIRTYSLLPYQELILHLENRDLLEEGLTKRDLALACLVAFHHFNLDKALGGLPLQKRTLSFTNPQGGETIDIPVFPGLADYQFQAILHYAKTEKWPLTTQGLFYELKRTTTPRDPSLLDAFYLSPEYHTVSTLLTKTGLTIPPEQIVDLICDGEWKTLVDFTTQQRNAMDLTPERKRIFLLEYLNNHSKTAAKLLLDSDLDFVAKRLGDSQILTLFDLYPEKSPYLEALAKELLASPRTDAVWQRAASYLYASVGEPFPDSYDHQAALRRFLVPSSQESSPPLIQTTIPSIPKNKKKLHLVEPGDNLWKIARKYHVSIEEIMRLNHLESEKLRPGKQLEIPEKTEKK